VRIIQTVGKLKNFRYPKGEPSQNMRIRWIRRGAVWGTRLKKNFGLYIWWACVKSSRSNSVEQLETTKARSSGSKHCFRFKGGFYAEKRNMERTREGLMVWGKEFQPKYHKTVIVTGRRIYRVKDRGYGGIAWNKTSTKGVWAMRVEEG